MPQGETCMVVQALMLCSPGFSVVFSWRWGQRKEPTTSTGPIPGSLPAVGSLPGELNNREGLAGGDLLADGPSRSRLEVGSCS